MLTRRQFSTGALGLGGAMALAGQARAAGGGEIEPGAGGLYTQPWFLESFLELPDDLAEAAGKGKHFAVIWEQKGCPYCRETHRVNFADERISTYIRANFELLQLDLWGSRKVTDFDGKEMEERELARRWNVVFTPTIVFFPADPAAVQGKDGRQAEVVRMPGYFRPFHFLTMFEYVRGRKYEDLAFQKFLQQKFAELQAKGISPDVW
jgi:thioredoxin-related protein